MKRLFDLAKRLKFWGKPKKPKLDFRGLKGEAPLKFTAEGPMYMVAGKGRTFKGKARKKE